MKFDIPPEQAKRAKVPHEIFLTNLVGNHILWFIAALGISGSFWQPLALVPVVSVISLVYTLWRARQSRSRDSWFVMCHWQLCAQRSRLFILMLSFLALASVFGWIAHTYLGMMKVAVYALIGGVGLLPVMVVVLVLIIMESDALHQAGKGQMPKLLLERYPNPGVPVLEQE
jgi:hypothetical protein